MSSFITRKYYYYIDLKGQLFLNSTINKNIATSLKDRDFLRFFYKQLRLNETGESNDYKYISKCGREMNYCKHEDELACVGFTTLDNDKLLYGGNELFTSFQPNLIVLNKSNGRLYHPLLDHKYLKNHYGLLSINVASELSNHIITTTTTTTTDSYQLQWGSKMYDIKTL